MINGSLADYYVRPIPPERLAQWERAREAYEREIRKFKRKPTIIAEPVAPIVRFAPRKTVQEVRKVSTNCLCGCGGYVARGYYIRHHRPRVRPGAYRLVSWDYRRYTEQLAKITDPLFKKVLMKEVGRA